MPNPNVYLPVPDPDATINGTNPMVPFPASYVTLLRFSSQANARNGIGGIEVAEWLLIASASERTDANGPFRYGTYDASQAAGTWYAYRFRDSLGTSFSELSAPWQPGGRLIWTLRDLIKETARIMGMDALHEGTATAGSTTSVTCVPLFKSVLRDEDYWKGGWLWVSATGDAGSPQDEERLIAGVDTEAGVAALDSDLSAPVDNSDEFCVLPMFPASLVKQGLNAVRRQMKTLLQTPIGMNLTQTAGNRYALPQGVYAKTDIARARYWSKAANIEWEFIQSTDYEVEYDGNQAWIYIMAQPLSDILLVEHKIPYYELEGPLVSLNDTTKANMEWLTKAAAWWVYSQIDRTEESESNFGRLVGITRMEVQALTGVHEPTVSIPLRTGNREYIGPVRAPV